MKGVCVVACRKEIKTLKVCASLPILFTGIGKVNAVYHLMDYLAHHQVDWVVNFGTAGSPTYPQGELVDCTRFFQRDMDGTFLNIDLGTTPFEKGIPRCIDSLTAHFPTKDQELCASGDSIVSCHETPYPIVDMEAYALAKVCHLKKLPFIAYKYITDSADSNLTNDWHIHVENAGHTFQPLYDQLAESIDASH